ncbi:MAG: LamG domain-containing protein, partial [Planctomycetaceae bacterium]|nr:LamG domain-containing protein [Planctomycetaceae bacterium]
GAFTGNANILAQTSVEANKTYDAVGTYDGQNWKLYVNGILRSTTSDSGRDISVNATHNGETFTPVWLVGSHGTPTDRREFTGTISEAEIYGTALTASQVSELSGLQVELTGPANVNGSIPVYNESTNDQFNVTITRSMDPWQADTSYDLDFKLTFSGTAEREDYEIYDGNTLISGANERWSNNGTVFSYKILTGKDSVTLTFKLVDNQMLEDAEETLTITLTNASATVNGTTQDIKIGTATATTVNIKNDKLNVKWQTITGTDANKATLSADSNSGGQRVFPEKSTPNGVIENKFELVFELEVAATANTTLYFKIFDPDNFIGLGNNDNNATAWTGSDNYASLSATIGSVTIAAGATSTALTVVVYPANYTGTKLTGNSTTVVIDSAHAGDNFIVVVDTDQTKVNTNAALGTTEDTRYKETNGLTQSELLTVWRTLWMELDQMATPTATLADGFDPSNQGTTWGYTAPANEPLNFDVLAQPTKPDISLLTTAMKAACIEVKEVSQNPENWEWIADENDSSGLANGGWRTETPFIHNLPEWSNDAFNSVANQSIDITTNEHEFWCLHGIGAYEAEVHSSNDSNDWTTGGAVADDTGVFLIFMETMRDMISTGVSQNGTQIPVTRSFDELNSLNTMHETLHLFGFADDVADGPIMAGASWETTDKIPNDVLKFSAGQIAKIQSIAVPK